MSSVNQVRPARLPILFLSVLFLTACGDDAPAPASGQAIEVTAITIEPQDTPVISEYVAKTASSRRVEIRSRVEGFLEKRAYVEGSMVEKGQVLFLMDKKPFEAELKASKAELAQQMAILETTRANLKRVEPLAKKNAVAQKELDDALGSYRTARAAVEQAKAKVIQAELNLGYCTITSPLTGISSFAVKREGAYLGMGEESLLTYVAQIQPMWVEFSISENQLLKMWDNARKGIVVLPEDGDYEVEIVLADGTVYPHRGQITFKDASLSEETGTFLIRAEIPNPDKLLRPGQFVRANLIGAIRPKAIRVPQKAVQQGSMGSFVWIIDGDGKAEVRPVKVGPWYGKEWFIDEGLAAGDRVVVDGALKLRAGMPVTVVEPNNETDTTKQAG